MQIQIDRQLCGVRRPAHFNSVQIAVLCCFLLRICGSIHAADSNDHDPSAIGAGSGDPRTAVDCAACTAADSKEQSSLIEVPARHVNVYAVPARFGGWPANFGVWSWGNEILCGFAAGHFKDNGPGFHAIDHDKPEHHLLARSLDGGETWKIEDPAEQGALIPVGKGLHGITPPGQKEKPWEDCPGGLDFTAPDFVMTFRMLDHHGGPSRFSYSNDRGKTWHGPFRLSILDNTGKAIAIAPRTDYIVNGRNDCFVFLTAAKQDGREGRPFCARTTDGARTWKFVSWIGDEPKGYAIMPSSLRLGPAEFLSTIRCREGNKSWIDAYRSIDEGKTWKLDTTPVPNTGEGNPPSMIRLADGRISLAYGFRAEPFQMRARLSQDNGRTWGPELVLRGPGGGRDIGYPVSVQRPDGKIVTIYYFHDQPVSDRYIAATIWDPGKPAKQAD
jgi:hypothetical protein